MRNCERVPAKAKATSNESAPVESLNIQVLGAALAISYFTIMLWSPIVVPDFIFYENKDLEMHCLRILLLLAVVAVYGMAQLCPRMMENENLKLVLLALAVLVSPFSLLCALVPGLAQVYLNNPALLYLAWFAAGFSIAVLMLTWGYDIAARGTKYQRLNNVAASSVIAGVFFCLTFALQKSAMILITILLPLFVFAIRQITSRKSKASDNLVQDCESGETTAVISNKFQSLAGKRAFLLVTCCGFVMGVAGAIGSCFPIMDWSAIYVGVGTSLAGIVMLIKLRIGNILSDRRIIFAFLPAASICLFLFAVGTELMQIVSLFIVFFGINVFNVLNTVFIDGDFPGRAHNNTADLLGSEFRTLDMLGGAVGWITATVLHFYVQGTAAMFSYFLIASVLACLASIIYISLDETQSTDENEHKKSMDSIMGKWEDVCDSISDEFKLSSREREILLLLSRGRDRQYIHDILFIAPSTVRTHTYNIYRKMGIHTQQQLIDEVETRFSKSFGDDN